MATAVPTAKRLPNMTKVENLLQLRERRVEEAVRVLGAARPTGRASQHWGVRSTRGAVSEKVASVCTDGDLPQPLAPAPKQDAPASADAPNISEGSEEGAQAVRQREMAKEEELVTPVDGLTELQLELEAEMGAELRAELLAEATEEYFAGRRSGPRGTSRIRTLFHNIPALPSLRYTLSFDGEATGAQRVWTSMPKRRQQSMLSARSALSSARKPLISVNPFFVPTWNQAVARAPRGTETQASHASLQPAADENVSPLGVEETEEVVAI